MADLLSPTNPVPKYDNASRNASVVPGGGRNIQNVTDPSRVGRPDGRTEQQSAKDDANRMRYDSNFTTFMQRLSETPGLSEAFYRLLLERGLQISSGISEGLAAELKQFLALLKMDEGQLLTFLKDQLKSGARFGGALFQSLRAAYDAAQSDVLRTEILQFLRRYSDYSSTAHLEGSILRSLFEMSKSLPSRWADQLLSLSAQFENGAAAGDRSGNLSLLRDQFFPMMGDYVQRTHDHGRARNLLSMLTLDLVRYENGGEDGLIQSFRHLNSCHIFAKDLGGLSDSEILRLLGETDFHKASKNDSFANHLINLTKQALNGESGTAAQEVFRNITASILINESVYLPLRHALLPFEWNGISVFSEMWVDPDSEEKQGGRAEDPAQRILIKMDIQNLGAFDLLFHSQGGKTSLQVSCPQKVAGFSGEISRDLGSILERNDLVPGDVSVAAMRQPLTISEVFPALFEKGAKGVDVKI